MSTNSSPSASEAKPLDGEDRISLDHRFAIAPEALIFSKVSDGAVRLYCILARHAEAERQSYPKRARLAKLARCSTDTIDRRVLELEAAGWLDVEPRYDDGGQRSNYYTVRTRGRAIAAGGAALVPEGGSRAGAAHKESQLEREQGNETIKALTPAAAAKVTEPFFEVFWQSYPKRDGVRAGKVAALKEWGKLKPEEREAALAGIPVYERASRGYPQDCERYLKHRRWVGLEVETEEQAAARSIAGAETLAEFFNVKKRGA